MNAAAIRVLHVAETIGLAFAVGAADYVYPLLTTGHVDNWSNVARMAALAGAAAVVARVRGLQFGVLRGFLLGQQAATPETTPAETPASKGNVQ